MSQRRVTVTSPQTRLAHARRRYRGPWRPTTLDPADAPRAVAQYRVQLRRAMVTLTLLGVLVVGLPLLLAAVPALDTVRVFGVPVSWVAVGVLPFPCMVLLAVWHLRHVERTERSDHSGSGDGGGDGDDGDAGGDRPGRGGPP